jgi:hypothetical protein
MTRFRRSGLIALLLTVAAVPIAQAQAQGTARTGGPKADPDWPCIQRKVPTLSAGQMWDGPDLTALKGWDDDPAIKALIPKLESRRTPSDQIGKLLDDYVSGLPADQRDAKLALLFAGTLDAINRDRAVVMSGIERFERRQKELAKQIEDQDRTLVDLRKAARSDASLQPKATEADEKNNWDIRVFTERQQSITYACEVPQMIEQRAFDVAREIRQRMAQ